jgi:hypothetical protein
MKHETGQERLKRFMQNAGMPVKTDEEYMQIMRQNVTQTQKKLGRPRVYTEPMTNAQRQQRWRDKQKQLKEQAK